MDQRTTGAFVSPIMSFGDGRHEFEMGPINPERPRSDSDEGSTDGRPKDEEERFAESMRESRNCVRCFNIALLLLGTGMTVLAFVGGEILLSLNWLSYTVAAAGFIIIFIAVIGLLGVVSMNAPRLLLMYYTMLIFATLGVLVLGGCCFVLTGSAADALRDNWERVVADMDPEDQEDADQDEAVSQLRAIMYAVGGMSFVLLLLLLVAMSNVVRLVTPVRAYSILLQSTNIALLPLGMALIAAGLYVADTAASVEAPFAAFTTFVLGMFVIILATIGCIGTALQSRGIVRVFMFLIGFFAVMFFVVGVLSLVRSSVIEDYLSNNWESVRRVLPPTFSGKYDKEQFERFVSENLQVLGFMALVTSAIFWTQIISAHRLRKQLKIRNKLEDRIDQLYAELQSAWSGVRDSLVDLKRAKRKCRQIGLSSDAIAARMARLREDEEVRLVERLEQAMEMTDEELEEIDPVSAAPPRDPSDVNEQLYNLRLAVYNRVRSRSHLKDVEDELDLVENSERRQQGALGLKSRAEQMRNRAKGPVVAGGEGTAVEGAEGDDDRDDWDLEDDRELQLRDRPTKQVNAVRLFWKQRWTKGTPRSRRTILCVCIACAILVAAVLSVAIVALHFTTSCDSMGKYESSRTYSPSDPISADAVAGNESSGWDAFDDFFYAKSGVTRGTIRFVVDDEAQNVSMHLTKRAFREKYANTDFPEVDEGPEGSVGLTVEPANPTRVLGFDVSCQVAEVEFQIPPRVAASTSRRQLGAAPDPVMWRGFMETNGLRAGVDLSFASLDEAMRPLFSRLDAETEGGPIDLVGTNIRNEGAYFVSDTGDISLDQVDARCDPVFLSEPGYGVRAATQRGTIYVKNSRFRECDVVLTGIQSLVRVEGSSFQNANGAGTLTLVGELGLIEISRSSADVFDVTGREGSIRASHVNVTEAFRVATNIGRVTLTGMRIGLRGIVQAETDEGDIRIEATEFAGIISVVTTGRVVCSGDGFDATRRDPPEEPCQAEEDREDRLSVIERIAVNCEGTGPDGADDCPYLGEMTVTSQFGNVFLTMREWNRAEPIDDD